MPVIIGLYSLIRNEQGDNVYFMPEHGNGISQAENEKNPKKYAHRWIDTILYHSIIAFLGKQVFIEYYREDSSFRFFRKQTQKSRQASLMTRPDGRKARQGCAWLGNSRRRSREPRRFIFRSAHQRLSEHRHRLPQGQQHIR